MEARDTLNRMAVLLLPLLAGSSSPRIVTLAGYRQFESSHATLAGVYTKDGPQGEVCRDCNPRALHCTHAAG